MCGRNDTDFLKEMWNLQKWGGQLIRYSREFSLAGSVFFFFFAELSFEYLSKDGDEKRDFSVQI